MFERKVTGPELGPIAGTRVALGLGIGFLVSSKLSDDQRKAAGLALTIVGALTTIPLVIDLIGRKGHPQEFRPAA